MRSSCAQASEIDVKKAHDGVLEYRTADSPKRRKTRRWLILLLVALPTIVVIGLTAVELFLVMRHR